jgi:hypothetical protein
MPAQTSIEEPPKAHVVGSSSHEHTSVRVEPPIEDLEVYELCMRALHGDKLDPREISQSALDAANDQQEDATVLEAPNGDRIWEMWRARENVQNTLEGIGYVIVHDGDI